MVSEKIILGGKVVRTAVALAVVLTAWAVGHVQGQARAEDNFLIHIDTPGGETTLACEKGCSWKTAVYSCSKERCYQWIAQDGGSAQKRQ